MCLLSNQSPIIQFVHFIKAFDVALSRSNVGLGELDLTAVPDAAAAGKQTPASRIDILGEHNIMAAQRNQS